MKEFLVYTGLRLLLLVGAFVVVAGIWSIFAEEIPGLLVLILALLLSGLASYFMLGRPRDAFARRVEERTRRASARFEKRRSREDVD